MCGVMCSRRNWPGDNSTRRTFDEELGSCRRIFTGSPEIEGCSRQENLALAAGLHISWCVVCPIIISLFVGL